MEHLDFNSNIGDVNHKFSLDFKRDLVVVQPCYSAGFDRDPEGSIIVYLKSEGWQKCWQ